MTAPLMLHGVVHLIRPAGHSASDLDALRAGIERASASSLFYHVHQPRLRHASASDMPPDDLSAWANGVVQDRDTAERLSFVVQAHGHSVEHLRTGLLSALDAIPGRARSSRTAPEDGAFVFLEMDSVPLELEEEPVRDCEDLVRQLSDERSSAFFYHLIERPWLAPESPSIPDWARAHGQPRLAAWLEEAPDSGRPLFEEQRRLGRRWRRHHLARRVAEAANGPDLDRRDDGRDLMRGLVQRIKKG